MEHLLNNKYYIMRNGDFATCANTKILYCLFAIILSLEDYLINSSTSCWNIMIGSTLIWTFIEFILYITNTRIIKPMYLNSFFLSTNTKVELPKFLALFLQGFQEGGLITTIGLYFGDRLDNINYMIFFHIFILFTIINILFKRNYQQSSKRQINTKGSLILMSLVTLYNTIMLYLYPVHIYRQLKMFLAMIYFCSFWTFFAWYKGFRTTQVDTINENNEYIKKSINYLDTFLILGYDVIFEIGIAYLTFYNLFIVNN